MATRIINGVNELNADLAGQTVSNVRAMLAQALNIDPAAKPLVNGEAVAEGYTLQDDDELEFVKASGEKG